MGKRHRENRQAEKKLARVFALRRPFRQTELGEVLPQISKAEARRRFLQECAARDEIEVTLGDELTRRATAEIQAEEDARCWQIIDEMVEVWRTKTVWDRLEGRGVGPEGFEPSFPAYQAGALTGLDDGPKENSLAGVATTHDTK